jgi:hypothetical protein
MQEPKLTLMTSSTGISNINYQERFVAVLYFTLSEKSCIKEGSKNDSSNVIFFFKC